VCNVTHNGKNHECKFQVKAIKPECDLEVTSSGKEPATINIKANLKPEDIPPVLKSSINPLGKCSILNSTLNKGYPSALTP
jgi:hypothetical protein